MRPKAEGHKVNQRKTGKLKTHRGKANETEERRRKTAYVSEQKLSGCVWCRCKTTADLTYIAIFI